ncbi:MAG: hypothetical protein ACRC0V_01495 [Fusobacteriaceae bacterium]
MNLEEIKRLAKEEFSLAIHHNAGEEATINKIKEAGIYEKFSGAYPLLFSENELQKNDGVPEQNQEGSDMKPSANSSNEDEEDELEELEEGEFSVKKRVLKKYLKTNGEPRNYKNIFINNHVVRFHKDKGDVVIGDILSAIEIEGAPKDFDELERLGVQTITENRGTDKPNRTSTGATIPWYNLTSQVKEFEIVGDKTPVKYQVINYAHLLNFLFRFDVGYDNIMKIYKAIDELMSNK